MKRLIILCLALFEALVLCAAPVSEQRARKVASDFFAGGEWQRLADAPDGCFVFNRKGGGFIIVSADDCALPVLAYSRTGSFSLSGAPDNLLAWVGATTKVIRQRADASRNTDSRLKAVWESPAALSRAGDGEHFLNTATWNQEAPFNFYTPYVDGEKSVTGCVALSMAIIMRHYSWPKKGSGTLPSYKYKTVKGNDRTQAGHSLGHEYNWADMPINHVPGDNVSAARLVYDCGIAVKSEYNEKATSAVSSDAPAVMAKYFGYARNALMEQRSYYSTSAWMARLLAEIDAGRPVLYAAFSEGEFGHAFVVDGYDDSSRLHVNWGWGGSCNGYFVIDCFFPYGDDKSKEWEYGYYYRHAAAFDLVPDKSGSTSPKTLMCMKRTDNLEGMRLSSGTVVKGSPFMLDFGLCTNRGLYDYSGGALRVGLVNKGGELKEFVGNAEEIPLLEPNYGVRITDYRALISSTPALGDALRVFYLVDGQWLLMPYSLDDGTVGSLPAGPDTYFIKKEGRYYEGQTLTPSLIIGTRSYSSLDWYLDGKRFTGSTSPLTRGMHSLKAVISYDDGTRETIVQEIEVP